MMSKVALTVVSRKLADELFHERCCKLDEAIEECLSGAFEGERISKQRAERIVSKFCDLMEKY
jgi:hypothetical protein